MTLGVGVFILSGAIAILVALITVGFLTFKATQKNPVDALRYE
jgi:ABC-type antimicrobial peptide transport system permease subunit